MDKAVSAWGQWVRVRAGPACLALVVLVGVLLGCRGDAVAGRRGDSWIEVPSHLTVAQSYPGGATGCVLPDPSGTGGCVTGATDWVIGQVKSRFGVLPGACWDRHAWNPRSDHPHGKACDYTVGRIGAFPAHPLVDGGWSLAKWLRANAGPLRVHYVIFQGRIWSREHDAEAWRPYNGGGVYDPRDVTGGHFDHVHVSTLQ